MKEETLAKYIGKTRGVLTCIELDHETYDKSKCKKSTYFKVKCSRCGKESVVRSDRFSESSRIPKACEHCINDLQREIALSKYPADTQQLRTKISKYTHCSNRCGKTVESYLTKEQVTDLLLKPCEYCGKQCAMGIDRIDSSKDYTIDNCVPCCGMCNIMKNKFDLQSWYDQIDKIYAKHHNERSTTISKESTSEANADGSAELLTAA